MANDLNINPWLGALSAFMGSMQYAGSQPYSRAGIGPAIGGGMQQGMNFYQQALQGQLMKRKIAEEERNKMVWESVGEALQGEGGIENAIQALAKGGTPETVQASLALTGRFYDAQQRVAEREAEREFRREQADREEKRWDKWAKLQRDLVTLRNPLAGITGADLVEPPDSAFGGAAATPPAAPGNAPAPGAVPTTPTTPQLMGPPDPRPLSLRYPVQQIPTAGERISDMVEWLKERRRRAQEHYKAAGY